MATVIDALVITLGLDPRDFTEGQKKAAGSIVDFSRQSGKAAKDVESHSKLVEASYRRVRNEVLALGAALLGVSGIKQLVQSLTTTDAAAGRLSANLNISTESLTRWQGVATRTGSSASDAASAFSYLSSEAHKFAFTGQNSINQYLESLNRLAQQHGGPLIDVNKPLEDQMLAIAENLKKMEELQGRAAAFNFGTMMGFTPDFVTTLLKGGDALKRLLDEQERLGAATKKDTDAAQALAEEWHKLSAVITDTFRKALTEVTPELRKMLKEFSDFLVNHKDDIIEFFKEMVRLLREAVGWFADLIKHSEWFRKHVPGLRSDEPLKPDEQLDEARSDRGGRSFAALRKYTGGDTTKAEQAMTFFKSKGYTLEESAAITANLLAESNLDPTKKNQGHFGIGQWDWIRQQELRKFATMRGKDVSDFETQLAFVDHEFNTTEARSRAGLKALKTDERAGAYYIAQNYMRVANPGTPEMDRFGLERADIGQALRMTAMRPELQQRPTPPLSMKDLEALSGGASPANLYSAPAAGPVDNSRKVEIGTVNVNGVDTNNVKDVAGAIRGAGNQSTAPQFDVGLR